MKIVNDSITVSTRGYNDLKDLTPQVQQKLQQSGLQSGQVLVFIQGSTAAVTTIEYEPGLVKDLSELLEKLVPSSRSYHHDERWGDANGFSHLRAALIGPSLQVPFAGGRLQLGVWQQLVLVDFDNRPRTRNIYLQFMGE
ncbi:MAG: secondary thiamine-phosphate synthase enzyme YjbQ [Candidatus Saccharicenans sp.]|jgi:secondary thiamine-phosphate synthase enzyme|nr:secondary thiamine-phosphate synthase enzyme YjbQ [Candidatus Saccharicenans sp.]MDH7493507.1 secondary thiamine-phosphate synthase enzyme YjbQ [Candidatus Saccharicenans sp.]